MRGVHRVSPQTLAAFLVLVTGPAGALRILVGSSYFYVARFALIGAGLLLAFAECAIFPGPAIRLKRTHVRVVGLYAVVLIANALVNTDSWTSSLLQLCGVLAMILLGTMITTIAQDREKAIAHVVSGYLLANLAYVIYAGLTYGGDSFNSYNGRFMGPFIGGHAATDVLFGALLVGIWLLLRGRVITGLAAITVGTWGTFITGVRSSSVIALAVLAIVVLQVWRGALRTKSRLPLRLGIGALLIAAAVGIYSATPELHGRLSGDDALSIEDDQRLLIWGFAADTLQDMASGKTPKVGGGRWLDYDGDAFAGSSLILGVGTRASFPYAISTEGVTYDEPVAWHNTWLALLIEAGVLGLLAHGAILFVVAKHLAGVMRRWFIDPNSVALLSVMAALIVLRYLLMSLTEMNLYTALSPGVMFFGTLFGILASREPTQILRNPVG